MLKDVQLCLEEARGARRVVPVRRRSRRELYGAGIGRGLGEQDFAAVLEVVEGLTGTPVVAIWRFALVARKHAMSFVKLPICREFVISETCA